MQVILAIGLILILGYLGGLLGEKLKLTRVVGYILIGILLGPAVFGFLSEEVILNLAPVTILALCFIAFSIGMKLKLAELIKAERLISTTTLFQSFATFLSVSLFTFIFLFYFKITEYPLAISLLLGAIASATAPAMVLAEVEELKARGPLTTLLLAIVALDDVLAIILFSIVLIIAKVMVGQSFEFSLELLSLPFMELVVPVILGVVIGGVVAFLRRIISDFRGYAIVVVGAILLCFWIAEIFSLSPLLIAMLIGFMVVNYTDVGDKVFELAEHIEEPLFIIFFVVAGASLSFGLLKQAGLVVVVYALARWLGKVGGGRYGAMLGKAPPEIYRWVGWGLLPQAGVAIALVYLIRPVLPQIADMVITIVLASIVIDEIIGPLGVELALVKSGEARM